MTHKKLLLVLLLSISLIGCDAAKEVGDKVADGANEAVENVKEMADIDFGDFDMSGLKDKFSSITDGFKDVTADNAGDLASKISGLTGALDGFGIGDLTGGAKTAVGTAISTFADSITKAMEGISDDGILSKIKPVVEALVEKLNSFM